MSFSGGRTTHVINDWTFGLEVERIDDYKVRGGIYWLYIRKRNRCHKFGIFQCSGNTDNVRA